MVGLFGLKNIADTANKAADGGYPELSEEYIVTAKPQIIFLADNEPADGGQSPAVVAARPGWSAIPAVQDKEVIALNDDIASRWGPRLPQLVERRGCVVVVSSIAGLFATPESVGYVTAKHGVIGLARSITRDYGPLGVRVNTVCPGWVRTPMADEEMDQLAAQHGLPDREAAYALATAQVPLRKPAEPAEVAAVVAFLASGHASAVSGAVLTVDCGGTAVDLPSIAFDSL